MSNIVNVIAFVFLLNIGLLFSQQKSDVIQNMNGKEYYVHKVNKGESLYGISKLYETDIESILNENPEVKEKGLKTGQNIKIPVKIKSSSNNISPNNFIDTLHYNYHKVQKGETVYGICKKYQISQDEFFNLNPDKKNGIKENDIVLVGRKNNVLKKQEVVVSNIKNEVVEVSKQIFPKFEKKKSYSVLLALPFGADKAEQTDVNELIKTNQSFPAMSSMMIDFYKGLMYAADSLKTDSFNVQILPIDIKETDSLKMLQLTATSAYKNSDVVIGPVYTSLIKAEQTKSDEKKFHIIPFVGYNKFLFNHPEYSKTTPSVYVDIQELARYVYDSLRKKSEVTLIYSNTNSDKEYAKEFKRYYNELIYKNNMRDTVRTFKSISDFKKYAREKANYTVVLLTNNQIIATDYITQLSIINKTSPVQLCGFYKTITFDNLDLEYLNQMNFVFSYYQNINYNNLYTNYANKYKNEFHTEPSVFFYEGMQIGLYYFNLIKTEGLNALYGLHNYPLSSEFMRFNFYRPDESNGFQNNGEFLFKIAERKVVLIK